jgi:hypothetical protein
MHGGKPERAGAVPVCSLMHYAVVTRGMRCSMTRVHAGTLCSAARVRRYGGRHGMQLVTKTTGVLLIVQHHQSIVYVVL